MKINLSTVLIVGGIFYLLTRPKPEVVIPIVDNPIPDDPGAENPLVLENAVDIYTTDANGNQVYHHTEVVNATGGTDIYVIDPVTGEYMFVKPKQVRPKGNTAVSGIRGNRTRSANTSSAFI